MSVEGAVGALQDALRHVETIEESETVTPDDKHEAALAGDEINKALRLLSSEDRLGAEAGNRGEK